jgi:copper chaperone CopZ
MTALEEPRLVHALPGRMRVHLAGWPREGPCAVEARLRQVPGVHSVQANPLTGNVLIHFDPTATDKQTLLAVVRTLKLDSMSCHSDFLPISPAVPHRQRPSRFAPGARPHLAGDPDVAGRASNLRNGRPRRLSLDMVDLILKAAGVAVSLILADSVLGLILSGVEVARLFMEVIARQSARRRGEVGQEHSRPLLIALGDAGAVDVPAPIGRGQTGRYA